MNSESCERKDVSDMDAKNLKIGNKSVKKKIAKAMRNEWVCFAVAEAVAWGISILCLLILAFLLYKFSVSELILHTGVLITYFIANLAAGVIAGEGVMGKRYLAGLITGAGYFMILLIMSLLINHTLKDFSGNFFTTLAICTGSGALGGILSSYRKR